MLDDYIEARKAGMRQYRRAVLAGVSPYPPVLDEILQGVDVRGEYPVGLAEIPLDKVVGTRSVGRTNAFSSGFMPILKEGSEFASKWSSLYDSQLEEGIRDPIKVYEFMNLFYVQEGNKRVSVSRYVGAKSIMADVTRVVPKKSDDKDVRIYYEFLDFYKVAPIYDFSFSTEGAYKAFAEEVGQNLTDPWPSDVIENVKASFANFARIYHSKAGRREDVTDGDAFLVYLHIYPLESLFHDSDALIRERIDKLWNEIQAERGGAELIDTPEKAEKAEKTDSNGIAQAMRDFLGRSSAYTKENPLRAAFIYAKDVKSSAWTYGHELGRSAVQNEFGGAVDTIYFDHCDSDEAVRHAVDACAADGDAIVFTTSPVMMAETLRCAIHYQNIQFMNCSVNMSSGAVRAYYGRMHEAKFLMGAVAAIAAGNHKIGYLADYPIFGSVASINAFAEGALLVDPRAKIHLKWSTVKGTDWRKEFQDEGVYVISGPDMIKPEDPSREYGVFQFDMEGNVRNLAAPVWNWGQYYRRIIQSCLDGRQSAADAGNKAINYWWGMEAGVIDVILSEKLPYPTRRLVQILREDICRGTLSPFDGAMRGQDGEMIRKENDPKVTGEEIVTMNRLVDAVEGSLPRIEDLNDEAQRAAAVSGLVH